jgi:hypothetical protein
MQAFETSSGGGRRKHELGLSISTVFCFISFTTRIPETGGISLPEDTCWRL